MAPRVVILCEDREHERFARRLCERHGLRVLRAEVAPSGRGAAEQWVLRNFPNAVKRFRAKNYQLNLDLVVVRDGDSAGHAARKGELEQSLVAAGLPRRGPLERVALLIPTWSIETWLAFLSGWGPVDESISYKNDPAYDRAVRGGQVSIDRAVQGWGQPGVPTTVLPSVADGWIEWARL